MEQGRANGLTVTVNDKLDRTPDARVTRAEFVARLLDLGRSCGDIPIYGSDEWEALDPVDPRRFASVVAAAECWRQDGEPDRMRNRLLDELEVADLIARWRIRAAGLDVWAVMDDWPRVLDVVQARRDGYREVA